MDISTRLNLSTDQFFQELEENKDAIQNSWSYITETLNTALGHQDAEGLLRLIFYIEQGDGALAYAHIGETRRILRILHIVRLECKYQKTPFFLRCADKDSLMEKYMLSLFAIRRLLFRLSEASMEDAAEWLLSSQPSVFAVYVITQEELLTPDNALYGKIAEICSAYWSNDDKELFSSLTVSA
ncbi:MAG: hypothetical protein NC548_11540 [Lachnospiraceae bacterium]|nr:hypothetical protein [Lachnospiraceae bacterium]